ncbi:YihY/virulence factor BrkB family protein [Streptomyces cucumeris]|uniref:YihY/virulence factor BrkB family protein n=1 Tax=Streptomyces cucumeris TaxID=2962890 RepID=UPI003D71F7EB
MEWLTRLPVVGPAIAQLMRTHAWRSYERLDRVHWTRLAAAITFISFLAFFPLIAVGAAIGAATLTESQMHQLQKKLAEQIPGISGQLDLGGLVDNAGTIGVVAGALLLFTGIGWVGSLRECLRAVWELEEDPGNPVARKLKDAGVLLGLGGVALVSFGLSTLAATAVGRVAGLLGIPEDGVGGWLLWAAAFMVAVVADFVLLCYVLTWLPGVEPPRRRVVVAALIGAIGFELLKLLLSSYLRDVAAKSMYGAFGVPIALLLWINFTAKLTLYCSSWTATGSGSESPEEADEAGKADGGTAGSGGSDATPKPKPESAGPANPLD